MSQFGALLIVLPSKSNKTFFNSGDLIVSRTILHIYTHFDFLYCYSYNNSEKKLEKENENTYLWDLIICQCPSGQRSQTFTTINIKNKNKKDYLKVFIINLEKTKLLKTPLFPTRLISFLNYCMNRNIFISKFPHKFIDFNNYPGMFSRSAKWILALSCWGCKNHTQSSRNGVCSNKMAYANNMCNHQPSSQHKFRAMERPNSGDICSWSHPFRIEIQRNQFGFFSDSDHNVITGSNFLPN